MRMRRSRVRPSGCGDEQTWWSWCRSRWRRPVGRSGYGQAVRHPSPYRVVAAGQIPGVMSMEALHAPAGAADPPAGRGPVQAGGISASRSAAYWAWAAISSAGVDGRFRGPHAALGFQPVDGGPFGPANQPVPGRHGRAIVE